MKQVNGMKFCPSCEKTKEIINFYKNSTKIDGLTIYCKECITDGIKTSKDKSISNAKLVEANKKICGKCKEVKEFSSFSKDSSKKIGYSSYCLDCHNKWKELKRNNPTINMKYSEFKSRAKGRKYLVELTLEEYQNLISMKCNYCGTKERIGIDRIDSSLGYSIDNSAPCCEDCNRMKLDHSLDVFKDKIKQIYEYLIKRPDN